LKKICFFKKIVLGLSSQIIFLMKNDNFSSVLMHFVGLLNMPINLYNVRDELRKHPDYYSLVAYSDVLENYGIYTSAYNVDFESLAKITLPAITCLSDRNYAVITKVSKNYVVLADDKQKRKKVNNEQFKKLYTGIVQVKDSIDTDRQYNNAKKPYHTSLKIQPYAGFVFGLLLIGLFSINSNFLYTFSWSVLSLTFLKLLGVFFATLLLIQSIDANNPLINRFCQASEKVDCGAILSSDAAKLTSFLSWSEVGFFYFIGTLLALLFAPLSLYLLAWLNLFALPYTFYSVYYQYKIAKKWCTLCCAVQALLWAEFLFFLPYLSFSIPNLNIFNIANLFLLFIIPVALWFLAKPILLRLNTMDAVEEQLRSIKYNKQIFNAALKENPPFKIPDEQIAMVLGSANPKHIITMVVSPFCAPCAQAHQKVEEALNSIHHLQVRIVFAGNNLNRTDETIAVRRHLIALNNLKDPLLLKNALNHWYKGANRNYKDWAKQYPVQFLTELDFVLTEQEKWVKANNITQTPTTLINGYKLPLIYQLQELKYMLDE
jgi:hypothetical protein